MTDNQKHILVVGSRTVDAGESQALSDMADFVQHSMQQNSTDNTVTSYCHLDEVGYVLDNASVVAIDLRNGRDLKDYDLVFFRGKLAAAINVASTIAQYLDMHHIPHLNTAYAKRRAVGKIPQMFQLAALQLAIPKTVSATAAYLPALIAEHLGYPAIVKDVQGAHGSSNFLVHTAEELTPILADNPDITFMAQEFIENDGDYRVLLVGEEVAIIHRKGQEGSHLNNTSTGGRATLVGRSEISEDIVTESRRFAELCEYEIAGVDVIVDKKTGKHYFLEINSQPQLASGAFTDLKSQLLAKHFSTLLGGRTE